MNPKLLRHLSLFSTKQLTRRCFQFSTTIPNNTSARFSQHSFEDDVVWRTSAVYSHALKFQRPASIDWRELSENKASFIGTVTRQPKAVNSKKNGNLGVFTVLKVSSSRSNGPGRSSSFRLVLLMSDGLAEFASKNLKENDFIYVSGCLGSYTKPDPSGNLQFNYKLIVKELDFVAQKLGYDGKKKLESIEVEAGIQNNKNRLYLWQVFFSNPYEWWDCRKRKLNPKQPDFKHKDTGEALWLSKYDPPWVKKQLELLDTKISEGGVLRRPSRISTWVYDE